MIPVTSTVSGAVTVPHSIMQQPVASTTGTLASLVTANPTAASIAMYSLPKSANQTVETYIQSACNQQPISQSVGAPVALVSTATASHTQSGLFALPAVVHLSTCMYYFYSYAYVIITF